MDILLGVLPFLVCITLYTSVTLPLLTTRQVSEGQSTPEGSANGRLTYRIVDLDVRSTT